MIINFLMALTIGVVWSDVMLILFRKLFKVTRFFNFIVGGCPFLIIPARLLLNKCSVQLNHARN
ncbi:hypothetical protein VH86_04820 [Pantoea sp. BL1]|nr:hypothetical protein VH86_04820 [Pantoea sp. BL1]